MASSLRRAATSSKKAPSIYDKKIPKNPKYDGVQSRIDTGSSVTKVTTLTNREYLKRRDEIFYRIEPMMLMELLEEYRHSRTQKADVERYPEESDTISVKIVTYAADEKEQSEQPYLILDVREKEEHSVCRIPEAKLFPVRYINQDRITADIFGFKNKANTLIILYCEDEKISSAAAASMVHKGFDNIYLLSGGIRSFSEKCPFYVEGELPPRPSTTASRKSTTPSIVRTPADRSKSTSSGRATPTGSRRLSRSGLTSKNLARLDEDQEVNLGRGTKSRMRVDDDVNSLADSVATRVSVAESVISRATARKTKY